MTERPILMSAPMVRAILDGKKTMTRRIVKPQPTLDFDSGYVYWKNHQFDIHGLPLSNDILKYCPYGQPGDILWVRETFLETYSIDDKTHYEYKADYSDIMANDVCWKPSIFMPRVASRIRLEVTGVRAERLQEIIKDENIEDIAAEGISKSPFMYYDVDENGDTSKDFNTEEFKEEYIQLWESINGKGSFGLNPWVWVVTFKRVE